MTKRVRVLVSGQVQGVFYRADCGRQARALGVVGFVRNLPDGRVEAAFEGPDEDVEAMIAWCHEGSDWARVDAVERHDEAVTGEGSFEVRRG